MDNPIDKITPEQLSAIAPTIDAMSNQLMAIEREYETGRELYNKSLKYKGMQNDPVIPKLIDKIKRLEEDIQAQEEKFRNKVLMN